MTQGAQSVTVEFDVPAPMRDGVTLRANVYRPAGDGPWPVLLTRLPYSKDDPELQEWLDPVVAARAGFLVVVQDTRGRFTSEGEWSPFQFEREDGYDTVEWAAGLPGSNGRVGMFGLSYFGSTQWMAAIEAPPSLGAIAPSMTWSDPLDGLLARGGAIELGLALAWTTQMGGDYLARQDLDDDERERRGAALLADYDRLPIDGYWQLPVHDSALLREHDYPDLGSIRRLTDPTVTTWSQVEGGHHRVTVPSLHVAGWSDIFLQGTLDNHVTMVGLGRESRLIVGPWTHVTFRDPIGELSYGIQASRVGVPVHAEGDLTDVQLAWFRRHLTAAPADAGHVVEAAAEAEAGAEATTESGGVAVASPATDEAAGPPVRIFVMGRNEWRDEEAWPLERAQEQSWFLGGEGTLGRDAPGPGAAPTTFEYDPADPVPTIGGTTVMLSPAGPFDQSRIEARSDVCVFTSAPLEQELEVTGRVRVVVHVQSTAPSTDWVARLCDVHPDGRSFNLCDGITRVEEGADALGRVEIDLWSTSNAFLPGHRLRVHVTSSSFPRWDRNLNTGDQRSPRHTIAHQRLHHDPDHPSWIELPVIP